MSVLVRPVRLGIILMYHICSAVHFDPKSPPLDSAAPEPLAITATAPNAVIVLPRVSAAAQLPDQPCLALDQANPVVDTLGPLPSMQLQQPEVTSVQPVTSVILPSREIATNLDSSTLNL